MERLLNSNHSNQLTFEDLNDAWPKPLLLQPENHFLRSPSLDRSEIEVLKKLAASSPAMTSRSRAFEHLVLRDSRKRLEGSRPFGGLGWDEERVEGRSRGGWRAGVGF